ncbi:DUF2064 domain-containing protein [Micromonospora sp. M12]
MDTPQVRPALLTAALDRLVEHGAVFGPALDGGWWALGLCDPAEANGCATYPCPPPTPVAVRSPRFAGSAYTRRSCRCSGMSTTGRVRWRSLPTCPAPGSRTPSSRWAARS